MSTVGRAQMLVSPHLPVINPRLRSRRAAPALQTYKPKSRAWIKLDRLRLPDENDRRITGTDGRLTDAANGESIFNVLMKTVSTSGLVDAARNCAERCCWSAGFLLDLPFPSPFHSGSAPDSPRFILIGSKDLEVKSRPNIFTLNGRTGKIEPKYFGMPEAENRKVARLCLTYGQLLFSQTSANISSRISEPLVVDLWATLVFPEIGQQFIENKNSVRLFWNACTQEKTGKFTSSDRQARALRGASVLAASLTTKDVSEEGPVTTLAAVARLDNQPSATCKVGKIGLKISNDTSTGMKGRRKRESPEKTHRPAASSHLRKSGNDPAGD
ncbi:hypothetical protein PR048_024809 [Dryococelus australis]|uniref:Uncharacterized protein n=1 Tax=Dryococelus australis TaxID=614101 RepID=A0ABQ9GPN4_9NEOP|nr:hypothetical protein PR048_024809 [Dryococelus australis]